MSEWRVARINGCMDGWRESMDGVDGLVDRWVMGWWMTGWVGERVGG